MSEKPFQRIGAISNAHAGADFESLAREFFAQSGLMLMPNFDVLVGAHTHKKHRRFDLGRNAPDPTLVECKSHKWTTGNNMPSAKTTVWNESMYYFHLAPPIYRKILFVLKDHDSRRGLTLAAYYIKNYGHLIPEAVEIWEYDLADDSAEKIH
jgi:hypothetical protein